MKVSIERDGHALLPNRLTGNELDELGELFAALPEARPGARIDPRRCRTLGAVLNATAAASRMIGPAARPVRALLFDKTGSTNWALGWHQDRTIEPAARIDVPGFGPWTSKQGRLHVAPPIAVTERMVTARIHLDAVDTQNAPLRVAPGSHRFGYVDEDRIAEVVEACGERVCLADAGAIWLYATAILHASDRAAPGRRRRVLQLDFAADPLPGGLEWAADRVG